MARTLFECAPMVLPTTGRAYTTSSARASLEVLRVASYVHFIFTLTFYKLAGPKARTVVAPLDRVKILFQASNPDFQKYIGMSSTRA